MTKYRIHKVSEILAAGGIDEYTKKNNITPSDIWKTSSITLTKEEDEALTKLMMKAENQR